jgi:Carboxypeptidase regulatory-like domain/Putative zinc-finger
MSELLQAGQHPDADQLNAFVEHSLPEHEQQQTLAHLAVCPACRQIVALSLPPGDESPTLQPEAVRHRWWAWAGIPALAALILVVLFVRNGERTVRQTSVPAQMADSRPSAPPPPLPAASAPPETARNAAPVAHHSNQKRAVAAGTQPAPLAEARQEPANGSAGGVMGGVLGGIAMRPTHPTMPGGSFAASSASAGGRVSTFAVDRVQSFLPTPGPLPSHLAILSMASRANQRLAIDTDNHLFFSDDDGRNWKTVPSQWKGRAVSVALTSAISFGGAAPALKLSSHPATTTAPALSGAITDPAGAVIPGATLTATNANGALVGSATTDSRGQYRMGDLAPGNYRIETQARGFETQLFVVELAPAQQTVADVILRVGSAAQTVTIQASPGSLDNTRVNANLTAKPPASQTLSRFELTTDDGERWTSTDGQTWVHE